VSSDFGMTWNTLCQFEYNISNLIVFDTETMIVLSQIQSDPERTKEPYEHWFTISRDAGKTWHRIDGLPSLSLSPMPIYRIGNKLFFRSAKEGEYLYLHSFDLTMGVHARMKINSSFYTYGISDNLLILPQGKGIGISSYEMSNNSLNHISKLHWGGWFGGSYNLQYVAKNGDYVFLLSSRYPGNEGLSEALHFSSDGGNSWEELALYPRDMKSPDTESFSFFQNDTIFQITTINGDTTRMYRVDKRVTHK
jgi:hypothetical protein